MSHPRFPDGQPERWRSCPGWEEYEVSSWGQVRRVGRGRGCRVGRIRSQVLSPQGYWTVMLSGAAGRDVRMPTHRLIVEAFIGLLGRGHALEVNHKNGVKADNRISNLERVTHQQNCQHGYDIGLNDRSNHRGERCGAARLTEKDVHAIRSRLASGISGPRIAAEFDVGNSTVYGIKWRKYWGWLPDQTAAQQPKGAM